ncbi:class I SAM-dependent methyltransferase [Actinokineospora bangkokensis]|uniref:Methyltransferase type 11 domain-containing protein n=1 Tax=Actinokineospora bangkokensis TaxID=1193682 RepID=A0A1Q9LS63_9PSEU|nr:class I SAM-dependent methyltransferase [Actinokineospora bangkokensis]OLR94841.1 hypothetical protein BJP25_09455 [Actinokineospora bangkokensis]
MRGLDPPPEQVVITSRDYDEYLAALGLDEPALLRARVLDCPGGASDFARTVRERGGRAVSADPLYAGTPDEVAAAVGAALERGLGRAVAALRRGGAGWSAGLPEYVERRRRSALRFLADYARDRAAGGSDYVAAALPALPFPDGAFDLAVVPNLLFAYADLFDLDWHAAAVRELVRVAAEVRVHPLTGVDGLPYPRLGELRRALAATGVGTTVRAGTLVCRVRRSAPGPSTTAAPPRSGATGGGAGR